MESDGRLRKVMEDDGRLRKTMEDYDAVMDEAAGCP